MEVSFEIQTRFVSHFKTVQLGVGIRYIVEDELTRDLDLHDQIFRDRMVPLVRVLCRDRGRGDSMWERTR